jgi:adenosylmethionine-8-amino-7-oxononanoate aminotransferase
VMEASYHGDTIGAMSVGARGVFNQAYEPLLFDVARIPFPHAGREDETFAALATACPAAAAFIVEPLVLGAGGMLMYPAAALARMKEICALHDVLFIADEVMTGWGRTGTLFACEQAGIAPDILCTSKGLTGGALPLAATLCRREIFAAHYSTDRRKTFFHSSSYTANPIACAAALANCEIWEREPVLSGVDHVALLLRKGLDRFRDDGRFENVRQAGAIAALDLRVSEAGYLADVGPQLVAFFRERYLLLRPLGNTIYVMPPYCVNAADIDATFEAIATAADRFA